MVKKFLIIFMLFIVFLGTTSLANVEMSTEDAEYILNYFNRHLNMYYGNSLPTGYTLNELTSIATEIISNANASNFADFFNQNFTGTDVSGIEYENLTVMASPMGNDRVYFYFIFSNNTYSNTLPYMWLYETSLGYKLVPSDTGTASLKAFTMAIKDNGAYVLIGKSRALTHTIITDEEPILYEDPNTINFDQLLGLSEIQIIYTNNELTQDPKLSYFLENTYEMTNNENADIGGDDGGNTGGGNTSGENTGGSTNYPDYSQELDNIQTGIGNVNDNLENLGNKIESGNKEVVGAVGEIKDFLSGDTTISDNELLEKFPESDIEDPSEDFFSWIFSQLENVFLSTETQTLEFSLFTENTYTISSDQIKVPDNAIKTLVGLSSAFGIFYWILKDVRKTINKVKEGSIETLATEDITANMV